MECWRTTFTHEFVVTKRTSEWIHFDLLNRIYKYPCSFENFLIELQKSPYKLNQGFKYDKIKCRIEFTKLRAWQFHNRENELDFRKYLSNIYTE